MKKNLEIEYKLLVSETAFYAIYESFSSPRFVVQTNHYFDTTEGKMRELGMALRIRESEQTFIATLKIPTTNGVLEYEVNVLDANVTSLPISLLTMLETHGITSTLVNDHTLTTERAIVHLPEAELCFDINHYNNMTDYEIEYEQTQDHDGKSKFQSILDPFGITFEKNALPKIVRSRTK
ncbi:MAG: CYTH domain-containing protein [Erysipelotrichaceae bacterium]